MEGRCPPHFNQNSIIPYTSINLSGYHFRSLREYECRFLVCSKNPLWLEREFENSLILYLRILALCSVLLGLHRTSVLRHDEVGQEVLLNLLLRNYLHYNLYDQVRTLW